MFHRLDEQKRLQQIVLFTGSV